MDKGIFEPKYKSCADFAIQSMAVAGIETQQVAFRHHIENAKKLGLMPNDIKVIRETLADYGFVMQITCLEGHSVNQVLGMLGNCGVPNIIFISVASNIHHGGYLFALLSDGRKYETLFPDPKPEHLASCIVNHVWIRWADGIDRSLYPRKTAKRKPLARETRVPMDSEHFLHFQPNPQKRYIGDCVVRGIASVMDVSWCEALDRLASIGESTVNSKHVYPELLKQAGFLHYNPILKNGRHLDGNAFCQELDKRYHNGERIFAHVGRNHVAAFIPTEGVSGYKIIDSWDSSRRSIGDYWVKPIKQNTVVPESQIENGFRVGDTLRHPSFGDGIVSSVDSGVMVVDFGVNGFRRLGEEWVCKNCSHIAA